MDKRGDSIWIYVNWKSDDDYSRLIMLDATRHANYLYTISDYTYIAEWRAIAYPILEQIANVIGALTGIAAVGYSPYQFIKWVRGRAKKRKLSSRAELKMVETLLEKNEWNASQLAETLFISKDEAKYLLKGFGYIWDPKKMLYIAIENTTELSDISSGCEKKARNRYERKSRKS